MSPVEGVLNSIKSVPRRLKNIARRIKGEPIVTANGAQAHSKSTPEEKLKDAATATNPKDQRRAWMDLILNKQFEQILDETFTKCAAMNHVSGTNDTLDAAELGVAMEMLYKRLDDMMGNHGKLPIVKQDVETIMKKYDADNNGLLDRKEFQGFARTYFATLEWPLWKTAARGAAKGVVLHVVNELLIQPILGIFFGAVGRMLMPIIVKEIKNLPAGQLKSALDKMRSELDLRLRRGKYALDSDGDGIPDEVHLALRRQLWEYRKQQAKTVAIFSSVFAAASIAGWV